MNDITGLNARIVEENGKVNMCKGWADLLEHTRVNAVNDAIYEMVRDGDITVTRAAQKLNISEEQVRANMTLLGYVVPEG